MEKKKDSGPVLKRDEHNILDTDHAEEVTKGLVKKLITEQRDFQKEITFKNALTNRRDILVKVIIYQKNTINDKVVQGDADDPLFERLDSDTLSPYRYKYFDHIDGEISVKEMPMRAANVGKWSMGMFRAVVNYLARMNVMDRL